MTTHAASAGKPWRVYAKFRGVVVMEPEDNRARWLTLLVVYWAAMALLFCAALSRLVYLSHHN